MASDSASASRNGDCAVRSARTNGTKKVARSTLDHADERRRASALLGALEPAEVHERGDVRGRELGDGAQERVRVHDAAPCGFPPDAR